MPNGLYNLVGVLPRAARDFDIGVDGVIGHSSSRCRLLVEILNF